MMSRLPWRSASLFAALAALFYGAPAQAGLQLCNQTSFVIYAAVGSQQASRITTRGWTRLVPGGCVTAIAEPLNASAYFAYARTAPDQPGQSRSWGGQFNFCAKDTNFALQTSASATSCGADDAFQVPFAPIATGGARNWTMTFTETPNFASPDDARSAGLRRLLDEVGFTVGAGKKALDDALTKFRAKLSLPASVNVDALFSPLEVQARKAEIASGYSICNDGDTAIYAALALKNGQDFVSRGWWSVAAGSCSVAVTDPLGRDAVYLYASKHGNRQLVTGPMTFCIADKAFEIHGREQCPGRGFSVQGFAATNTKGLRGFTAHVGNAGLVAP